MNKKIYTNNAPEPVGPYSQAILSDNHTLYISGQIPLNPKTGKLVMQSVKEQTKQVMENLKQLLFKAGMDFSDVVKTTIFLTDMKSFTEVNEVYGSYFIDNFPARETVQVSQLPKNVDVEISMIAYK